MTTEYLPAGRDSRQLTRSPSRYVGAAALVAAIRVAAQAAPEEKPRQNGRSEPGPGRAPEDCAQRHGPTCPWEGGRVACERTSGGEALEVWRLIREDWHGPLMPAPHDVRVSFAYAVGGATGRMTIANLRGDLLRLADKVHKARGAFDGKTKRGHVPKVASVRNGSAPHVAAREAWSAGRVGEALTLAEAAANVFFGRSKPGDIPTLYMVAERRDAGGHSFVIGRAVMGRDSRFWVLHADAGCTAHERAYAAGFTTCAAAIDYLDTSAPCDAWVAKITEGARQCGPFSQDDARAVYEARRAAENADEPADADTGADAQETGASAPEAAPMPADSGERSESPESPAIEPEAEGDAIIAAWRDEAMNPRTDAHRRSAIVAALQRHAVGNVPEAIAALRVLAPGAIVRHVDALDWERRTGERTTGDHATARAADALAGMCAAFPWSARFNLAVQTGREGDPAARPMVRAILAAIAAAPLPEATEAARVLAELDSTPNDPAPPAAPLLIRSAWNDAPASPGYASADVHPVATVCATEAAPGVAEIRPTPRAPRDGDSYRIHEMQDDGTVWTGGEVSTARRSADVRQCVIAGQHGPARWCTCAETGAFLFGMVGAVFGARELTEAPAWVPLATQPAPAAPGDALATQSRDERGRQRLKDAASALHVGTVYPLAIFSGDGPAIVRRELTISRIDHNGRSVIFAAKHGDSPGRAFDADALHVLAAVKRGQRADARRLLTRAAQADAIGNARRAEVARELAGEALAGPVATQPAPESPHVHERPCAAPGLTSYRARGRYGWVMIGARDDADAQREAERSTDSPTDLQVWDGARGYYVPCGDGPRFASAAGAMLREATAAVLARNPGAIGAAIDAAPPVPAQPAAAPLATQPETKRERPCERFTISELREYLDGFHRRGEFGADFEEAAREMNHREDGYKTPDGAPPRPPMRGGNAPDTTPTIEPYRHAKDSVCLRIPGAGRANLYTDGMRYVNRARGYVTTLAKANRAVHAWQESRPSLDPSGPARRAAVGVAGGMVHVLFGECGETFGHYMDAATYRAIPLHSRATPADYAAIGKLQPAPAFMAMASAGQTAALILNLEGAADARHATGAGCLADCLRFEAEQAAETAAVLLLTDAQRSAQYAYAAGELRELAKAADAAAPVIATPRRHIVARHVSDQASHIAPAIAAGANPGTQWREAAEAFRAAVAHKETGGPGDYLAIAGELVARSAWGAEYIEAAEECERIAAAFPDVPSADEYDAAPTYWDARRGDRSLTPAAPNPAGVAAAFERIALRVTSAEGFDAEAARVYGTALAADAMGESMAAHAANMRALAHRLAQAACAVYLRDASEADAADELQALGASLAARAAISNAMRAGA